MTGVPPATIVPKLSDEGFTEIFDAETWPKRVTLVVPFFISFDDIVKEAAFFPKGSVGLNVTVTVHVLFAATAVQVFV